ISLSRGNLSDFILAFHSPRSRLLAARPPPDSSIPLSHTDFYLLAVVDSTISRKILQEAGRRRWRSAHKSANPGPYGALLNLTPHGIPLAIKGDEPFAKGI